MLLLGGVFGLGVGVGAVLLLPRWLGRLEPAARRRRREALQSQAPLLADLLAATLTSGATLRASLQAVVGAVDEPGRSALRPAVIALDLGADATDAMGLVDDDGALAPIVDAITRSAPSGARLSQGLLAVAEDLRRTQRRTVDVAARSAGVRAVAPLAACFLPAFVLLGVVPVVVSLASAVLGGSSD